MIYDTVMFLNEIDLLEIRLNILNDVVDKFKDRWGSLVDRTTGSLPARDDDHARELLRAMAS